MCPSFRHPLLSFLTSSTAHDSLISTDATLTSGLSDPPSPLHSPWTIQSSSAPLALLLRPRSLRFHLLAATMMIRVRLSNPRNPSPAATRQTRTHFFPEKRGIATYLTREGPSCLIRASMLRPRNGRQQAGQAQA